MGAPVLRSPPSPTRTGFVTFAGVMVLIAATFNLLDGIVALVNDDYYVADELLFGDFTAWGIWWLFIGALQFATGYAILARNSWGIVMGIGLAAINALTQLMFLGVYPAWSIAVIVVDGLIIYALTTRVEEFD
jgi:hypothetical protein